MSESPHFSELFESLRAEFESIWLSQAFLPPREFGLMAGQPSILVIGEEGSGKTALEMQLWAYAAQKRRPYPLVASWRPEIKREELSSDEVVSTFVAQTMNSLAFAFLQEIAKQPAIFQEATSWVQDFVTWFTTFYLQGDREFHLSRLSENCAPEGIETVKKVLFTVSRPILPDTATASEILSHLSESTKRLGFDGVWVFIEDLDVLFRSSPDKVTQNLKALLSTLDIFETPAFSIKIITPSELGLRLQATRGAKARRFGVHYLRWQMDELLEIVERRIALVLKRESVSITEVCADKSWLQWLKQYAGETPRGWLDLTRPVVAAYLKKGSKLSATEWQEVYRQSPPLLNIDLETRRVFVGYGEVPVSEVGYRLLCYLYENRFRACSKSELYFCAHKALAREPRAMGDEGWEDQSIWEGVLDTALWRLRQAIEWNKADGNKPIYIVSTKGRGQIRLLNTT